MIKNIIFDIGNVLAKYDWKKAMKQLNFPNDVIEVLKNEMIFSNEWKEMDKGILSADEVVEEFIRKLPSYAFYIHKYFENGELFANQYSYSNQWIASYKKRGFHVYYLSNYPVKYFELHAKSKFSFLPLMDGGIVSGYVKMIKPDAKIYELLLEKYHLKAQECIFIDDSYKNIEGCKNVGINGVVKTSYKQAKVEIEQIIQNEMDSFLHS